MTGEPTDRMIVPLDLEHATRLRRLAERRQLDPGLLAGSLLSSALDAADPDPDSGTALLDRIPGAWDDAQAGMADAAAGRVIPLDAL